MSSRKNAYQKLKKAESTPPDKRTGAQNKRIEEWTKDYKPGK